MKPKEEVFEEPKVAEFIFDMDNPPKQDHFWVDRGLVMSCEGAAHPNHRVYKRRK